ncbi:hypothetical protein FB451DRAFT_1565296 [Mycena latifolia]|nr:hypothetical protein FB451DRAFT_1565296 [Mycena latifolia]
MKCSPTAARIPHLPYAVRRRRRAVLDSSRDAGDLVKLDDLTLRITHTAPGQTCQLTTTRPRLRRPDDRPACLERTVVRAAGSGALVDTLSAHGHAHGMANSLWACAPSRSRSFALGRPQLLLLSTETPVPAASATTAVPSKSARHRAALSTPRSFCVASRPRVAPSRARLSLREESWRPAPACLCEAGRQLLHTHNVHLLRFEAARLLAAAPANHTLECGAPCALRERRSTGRGCARGTRGTNLDDAPARTARRGYPRGSSWARLERIIEASSASRRRRPCETRRSPLHGDA